MKISIIIPVYNSSLTLKECLGAVLDSSFKNFEVIIVSDNSLDDSVNIAKKYNCKIILPSDVVISEKNKNLDISNINKNHKILDLGKNTLAIISDIINNSKTLIWSGPLGYF